MTTRAGVYLKAQKALAHAGDKLCACGHTMREHRELRSTLALVDGTITETPHPDYKPLHFHCSREGCDCLRIESAA
jgi:hypothetical protein